MPRRYRVLVVDDFPDGREMLAEYLRFRGFDVLEATDGATAIATAQREQPDIVLMDLGMPIIDGWQATKVLRGDPTTRDLLIVALTSRALTSEMQSALDVGCDAVVAKPYDLPALADAINLACRQGASTFSVRGVAMKSSRQRSVKSLKPIDVKPTGT